MGKRLVEGKWQLRYLFGWILGILLSTLVHAEKITLAADEWCPYNCHPNTPLPGILVELAQSAWKPLGLDVDYQVLPWSRAKQQAQMTGNLGLLGAGRGLDEKQFLYGHVPPLISPFCFYTKPANSWSFFGVKSLENTKLGTAFGYNYDGDVGVYIKQGIQNDSKFVEPSMGDVPVLLNLDKLQANRIDAVLEDRLVMQYMSLQSNVKFTPREAGCIVADDTIYIVLPTKMPNAKKLMNALDQYIVQTRKDGRFKLLLQKYGIQLKAY